MSEHMSNNHHGSGRAGGVALGLLMGSLVGAGVALLIAPKSGAETRRTIKDSARRFGDGANRRIGTLRDAVGSKIHTARAAASGVKHAASGMKDCVDNVKRDVKDAVRVGREAAHL